MNVEPTAKHIDEMAHQLIYYADQLKRVAAKMRETGDISYAAEAMNAIPNCVQNLRLDLLVMRPLREFEK